MALVKRKPAFIGIEDLGAGDIIAFDRAYGLYFHCGIYVENGYVIHRAAAPGSGSRAALDKNSLLASFGKECDKAEIRRDVLTDVAGSSDVYKTNMFDEDITPFSGQEIVKRAEERIGQKGYNVLFKNCQHFCTEARYGVSRIMQFEKLLGNEMNSTLVNIVNLSDMSFQQVANTTANTTAVENIANECGESCARGMLQCMDLGDQEKELCAQAGSCKGTQPLLTIPKHYNFFTEYGKSFDRYLTNFNCTYAEIKITSIIPHVELLDTSSSAIRPFSKQFECIIGNSAVSDHVICVRLEYTNFNINPFRTFVTSNCSINGKGRVILRPAEQWSGTSKECDTHILFAKFEIKYNTAGLRFVARSLNFDVNRTLLFYQDSRLHYGPQALNSSTNCTDMRTDVNRSMAFSYENAGKQLGPLDVAPQSCLRATPGSPSNCSLPQSVAESVSQPNCSIPQTVAENVSKPNCSKPQSEAENVSQPNCSIPQSVPDNVSQANCSIQQSVASHVSPPICSIPEPLTAANVSLPSCSTLQPAASDVSPLNCSIPQPWTAANVSLPSCSILKPVAAIGCYEVSVSLDDIYTTCKGCTSENSISDETNNELFYVCVFIFVLLFLSFIFWSILDYSDSKRQQLRARLSGRT